jgi:hypothetical protein
VDAPDAKAAELAAVKAFTLNEWQRKRPTGARAALPDRSTLYPQAHLTDSN